MRLAGVDVGVEPVLGPLRVVPERGRLPRGEVDRHDRLDALVAVLPRHDDAHRRAVLFRQNLAVHTRDHHRQRVHGLVHAQALVVGPLVGKRHAHAGHLRRTVHRHEPQELRLRLGIERLDQIRQREAHPRNRHRPRLHAAEPVEPLFVRELLQKIVDVELHRLGDQAGHVDRPGPRLELADQVLDGFLFGRMEFVEVVVAGGGPLLGDRAVEREFGIALGGEYRGRLGRQNGRRAQEAGRAKNLAAITVNVLGRGLPLRDLPASWNANRHDRGSPLILRTCSYYRMFAKVPDIPARWRFS